MKKMQRIAMTGLAGLAVAVGTLALPFTQSAGAMSVADIKKPQKVQALQQQGNTAVDVSTELDCSSHTLTAKVVNKTGGTITPNVTFNEEEPSIPSTLPIEPGETGTYFYHYSGNNLLVETEVKVDTFDPVTTSSTLYCSEPVSFRVTDASESAVVGELRNNSTITPQTAYTRVGSGDIRLETLEPGESRTIALPFHGMPGQTNAMVTIATWTGFESTYNVDLERVITPLPIEE